MKIDPFNITVMDVNSFIHDNHLPEVTTTLIKVPSSTEYHPQGLFSEDIFGLLGSEERFRRKAYIDLHCEIIAPVILRIIKKICPWHIQVMAGNQGAVFDKKTKTLIKSDDPEAETGFRFYMSCYPTLVFPKSESLPRQQALGVLDKFRKRSIISKFIVEPAGLRELSENSSGRLVIDDINKLYIQLLGSSQDLPSGSDSSLFDPIKFQIQSKGFEIYSYLENTMTGKKGFLLGHYASRTVALGTRNVIASVDYSGSSPDDPQFLKANETRLPLFQTMKGLSPVVYHIFRKTFLDPIFSTSQVTLTIPVYDPKTFERVYVDIDIDTRVRFTSPDGVMTFMNRFRSEDVRMKPITIKATDGKIYYPFIVADFGDILYYNAEFDDVKQHHPTFKKTQQRSMTWAEIFYVVTYIASQDTFSFITRYPITGDESCYPSHIHLVTTDPGRIVDFSDGTQEPLKLPQYPVLGRPFLDGVGLSAPRLGGLGADHDGDTISCDYVMSEEAKKECHDYINSTRNVVDTQGKSVSGSWTDLNTYAMFALTYREGDI